MLPNLQAVGCEAAVAGLWRQHHQPEERGRVERHAEQGGCGRQGRRRRRLRDLVPSVQGRGAGVRQDERGVHGRVVQHVHPRSRARRANCGSRRPRACARQYGGLRGGGSPAALAPQCSPGASEAPPKTPASPRSSARSCVFAKFNTDEVRGMGSLLGISAMPTFKVFKAKAEVGCQRGWNESRAVLTMSPPREGGWRVARCGAVAVYGAPHAPEAQGSSLGGPKAR